VDRVFLGKPWLDMQEVHARTQGSRVFWDRFWKHDTRDTYMYHGGNMSNRDTTNDLEVLVTMSGFQRQTKHKEFYLAFLQDKICPFLMDKIPMGPISSSTEPAMTWSMTGNPIVFKLTCSHSSIARYLCVELVDMHVRQEGNLGPHNFKSTVHSQKNTDWSKLFSNPMIQDVSQEFRTRGPSPTSTTSWQLVRDLEDTEAPLGSIQE